ncbi:uridine kinase [Sanguibacter sp. 4.1]|uniref:Uridine kinase n=1 Tax=Sanguibacter biliveldensis TaxID=3030830 RepID=A0AAF0Z6D7_9MICO|nr:uridine kinase [Sanguibacter sp. 4.1]WPF83535.1 uridine kinase [Sanguibacter sp. 4.1]
MHVPDHRSPVVSALLDEIELVRPGERVLVALDGVDGVGKTHLAHELAGLSAARHERPLVRVSIDGFHRPRAERRAAGLGAEGFYRGSYRYEAFRSAVVDPLRAGQPVVPAVWDVDLDEPVTVPAFEVPPAGILLVDGIFLQRPELADVWDAVVWVDAPLAVTVPRGNARLQGSHDPDPEAASNRRYVGGQRLYLAEADPRRRATWVFDNTDLARPHLTRGAGRSGS